MEAAHEIDVFGEGVFGVYGVAGKVADQVLGGLGLAILRLWAERSAIKVGELGGAGHLGRAQGAGTGSGRGGRKVELKG